jgi:hypothetical protein
MPSGEGRDDGRARGNAPRHIANKKAGVAAGFRVVT